ncbi:CHAT domain-containing protein [bacterium]|nr:CHAT domain-containing protein [bacterium]
MTVTIKKALVLGFFGWLFIGIVHANHELPEIHQITTHPQMDFQPAVSPDGRWLAFVSSRSGNLDIWLKPLPRGRAVQITTNRSEDLQPVWMPDSKMLVFTSKRRDAMGDLWRVRIDRNSGRSKGKPEQLTKHLGWDQSPSVSPDGRYIAYVSDMHGGLKLHIMNLKSRKIRVLAIGSGAEPRWSPDNRWLVFTAFQATAYGDLMLADMEPFFTGGDPEFYQLTSGNTLDAQACWSQDGHWIVFQRIQEDTDGDGKLSPEDHGSLWEKEVRDKKGRILLQRQEFQLTTKLYHDLTPCCHDSMIYFTSHRGGGEDIWAMPMHGLISQRLSVDDQYMAVFNRFGMVVSPPALRQALLGYRRVLTRFPQDSLWCARSWMRIGEYQIILEEYEQAKESFQTIRKQYASWQGEAAEAAVKEASVPTGSISSRIALCQFVIDRYPTQKFAINEARLLQGDLFQASNDIGRSVAAYSAVVQSGIRYSSLIAQAKLRIGDLFETQGQSETARQSYLAVLREYGQTPLWRQRAIQRIMAQVSGSLSERIAAYKEIQSQASDLPSLVSEAQLAIGQCLMDNDQFLAAIQELEQVDLIAPRLRWAQAKSRLMQAFAYDRLNDFLKSRQLLVTVIENYADVEGGHYRIQAEQQLFDLTFNAAERSKSLGDFPLAAARYEMALRQRPEDIRVHRGLVESNYYYQKQYQNGKLDSLIQQLKRKIQENPDQPVLQYGLGLALSYAGERDLDMLESSNTHLLASLEDDYRLIYPYRTLGYNYELMERLVRLEQSRRPNLIQRAGKVIFTPVRWMVRLFQKEKDTGPVQYYEKAIEVLTTAIELNDERENVRMEAELAQNLANNFYNLGEYGFPKAYRYYQKRLSLDTTFHQSLEKAIFYSRAGHCALGLDNYSQAEHYLKTSIRLYESLGRESLMAQDQGRLAYLFQRFGHHQEAITLYEVLADRDFRQSNQEALIRDYRNIAYNYHELWEPEDAVRYSEKAEAVLKTRNIPMGPPEKSYLRWEFFGFSVPIWGLEEIGASSSEGFTLAEEAAFVFSLISRNAERLKDFSKAVLYEEKRLAIFQKRRDKLAQRISMNRIGVLLMKQGRYEDAWEKFKTAYDMSRKADDNRGRWINAMNLGQVVIVQLSLSGVSGHRSACRQLLLKEIDRLKADGPVAEKQGMTSLLGILTFYEIKVKDAFTGLTSIEQTAKQLKVLAEADHCFNEALGYARQQGSWREQAILLKSRATAAILSGDRMYAANLLKQAETLLETGGGTYYLWRVRYALAGLSAGFSQIQRDSMNLKNPLWYYQSAIEGLESLPVIEEDSELRMDDRSDRWYVYIDAAITYAEAHDLEMSFTLVERGREKRVADILARRPPNLRRERHKNLWRNLRDVRARLGEVRKQILSVEMDSKRKDDLKILKDKADLLKREYESFMADIQAEDPVLAYLSGASDIDVPSLQSTLREGHGALSYMIHPDRLTIHALDRDTIFIRHVPIEGDTLKACIQSLQTAVRQNRDASVFIDSLSQWLLFSLEDWLMTRSHLILIPDDVIWQVPFELLRLKDMYITKRQTICYSPSLMAYKMAGERRRINQSRLLLTGDSWDIPITSGIPQQTELLIGSKATESMFKENIVSADLIHMERWMLPNEKSPLTASIILAPDSEKDGYLHAQELFEWDIPASMVKLPVSRMDPAYQSWELYYYAFLYAGTPSMIFTRWSPTTESRIRFFQAYYCELVQLSFAGALTATIENLISQSDALPIRASYGLMGYEGMDAQDRLVFARQNLVSTVMAGRHYMQMDEYQDAIGRFEQALVMAESMKDSTSIRGIMLEIIRAGMQGEIWEKAIAYQKRMIDLFGASENMQVAQQNLVTFYYRSGRFQEAAETKEHALEQNRTLKQWHQVAQGAMELAVIYASARNYQASVHWADEAYQTYLFLDQAQGKARSLIWKGRSLLDSDRFFEARAAFGLAIEILEKEQDSERDFQTFELATAYQLRGICLENLSLYQEAIDDQYTALSLLKSMEKPLQVAQGQQYLANVSWKMGAFRQALMFQEQALKAFETLGQRKHMAMAYSTQGLIQMSLGEVTRAKVSEEKAYKLANRIQSREDEATILKNMGQIAIQEYNFEEAFQYFRQAMDIDSSLGLRRGLSYDYRNQGMLLIQMRQFNRAITMLQKGLSLAQSVQDLRNQIQCFYGLGLAHLRTGQFHEALAAVDSGMVLAKHLVVPALSWRLRRQRGQIHWALKNRDEALTDFKAAVEIVERMRAELKIEAFKQGFFDSKMDLYQDIIQLLLEMRERALAFHYVERAKSRDFIDMLANQQVVVPETQKIFLDREKILKTRIQEAQNQIAQHRDALVWEERGLWEDSLRVLHAAYSALVVSIQATNPELASLISVDPWTADLVQAHLPQNVAIIEYYWGARSGYCWVVTPDEIKLAFINVSQEELGQTIKSLREKLVSHLSVDQESRLLFDWLISPVDGFLEGISHIIIVPHGILHYLPFSVLQDERGFIVDRFTLSLAPSSTVLGYCLNKGGPTPNNPAQVAVTAFGNPDLADPLLDLPYAEKEIVALEWAFPEVTAYSRLEANEANVKNHVNKADILHFACHATYEPEAPLFSSLLLSPASQEDGRLETQEIFGLDLNCHLITLSACETGLGRITQGDEIIGLARSFIYAGTPSILTSLWKVDDLATAVMMKRFYRYLAAGNSRSESLRQAQLIVRELVNPHPSAWAAFYITGDYR